MPNPPAAQPQIEQLPTLREKWQSALNEKPSPTEAVALLSTCLALVRPVGLTDRMADDWLAIAAQEVAYIPLDVFHDACAHARRTCHHHGRIVPTIVAYSDPVIEQRRKHVSAMQELALTPQKIEVPKAWLPTQEELEAIKAQTAASLSAGRPSTFRAGDWPE